MKTKTQNIDMPPQHLILILILNACLAVSPRVQAVSPPPDGGYPGGNTAEGHHALFGLTSGTFNTAVGFLSLTSNTEGSFNTAIGAGALLANIGNPSITEGIQNTATGAGALLSNTTGHYNTADGAFALFFNTGGDENTATGNQALFDNTTGYQNTAAGYFALYTNTTGHSNTASGAFTLSSNTEGNDNTAIGNGALGVNAGGANNTAVGVAALSGNSSGSGNIALGFNAGQNITGNNNIAIGHDGFANADNSIVIGNDAHTDCHIAGIYNSVLLSGQSVAVASDGKLGYLPSSARFKRDIEPMGTASEDLLALKPVTFHYKGDKTNAPQFGLVAEEVAKINPHLVVRSDKGELHTVRYDQVNAMLLNEFLKEHKKVEQQESRVQQQEAIITQLKKDMRATAANQQKQIEALTAGLQKVSAQLEVSKSAPQTVQNNR